jgi:hypothetical protein
MVVHSSAATGNGWGSCTLDHGIHAPRDSRCAQQLEALYRRPRTTKPEPGHKIYSYLLRGMEITRPNQVWAMDITYIPMGATKCSSSAYGEPSNTRNASTKALPMPEIRLGAISTFTIPDVHIRALTAQRLIRPTPRSCYSARQHNHGRGPTYRRGNSVQRFGASAVLCPVALSCGAIVCVCFRAGSIGFSVGKLGPHLWRRRRAMSASTAFLAAC